MTSNRPSLGQRVLLLESITGSGMSPAHFPDSLWREATAMREALAVDLRELIGARVMEADVATEQVRGSARHPWHAEPPWAAWRAQIEACDAFLPVAPEAGGELLALTILAGILQRRCLGSRSCAVRIAGSKWMTARVLAKAGVPVVPAWPATRLPWPASAEGWVVKPDDGAGAEATHRVPTDTSVGAGDATFRGTQAYRPWVVQPFLDGASGSLFAFGRDERLRLLASSTQHIEWHHGQARLVGLGVNESLLPWTDACALAARIADALPGLDGFWGADFILGKGDVQVLEINPRPTSTYPALSRSLGWNPARLLLGLAVPADSGAPGRPIRLGFE